MWAPYSMQGITSAGIRCFSVTGRGHQHRAVCRVCNTLGTCRDLCEVPEANAPFLAHTRTFREAKTFPQIELRISRPWWGIKSISMDVCKTLLIKS